MTEDDDDRGLRQFQLHWGRTEREIIAKMMERWPRHARSKSQAIRTCILAMAKKLEESGD